MKNVSLSLDFKDGTVYTDKPILGNHYPHERMNIVEMYLFFVATQEILFYIFYLVNIL